MDPSETTTPAQPSSPQKTIHLFGHPLQHTLAPTLHNAIFANLKLPWTYEAHPTESLSDILTFLRRPDAAGAAITMPHKVAIAPHLDMLAPSAEATGAVNTVLFSDLPDGSRVTMGTNTDVVGVREALKHTLPLVASADNGTPSARKNVWRGRPALVIGGGGAARSALYSLAVDFKCDSVYLVSRDPEETAALRKNVFFAARTTMVEVSSVEQARALEPPVVAVACVPDLEPVGDEERRAREIVDFLLSGDAKEVGERVLLEMAYHPRVWTGLATRARDKGWRVVLGVEAMIWQGVEQDLLWTDEDEEDMRVDEVREMIYRVVKEQESS